MKPTALLRSDPTSALLCSLSLSNSLTHLERETQHTHEEEPTPGPTERGCKISLIAPRSLSLAKLNLDRSSNSHPPPPFTVTFRTTTTAAAASTTTLSWRANCNYNRQPVLVFSGGDGIGGGNGGRSGRGGEEGEGFGGNKEEAIMALAEMGRSLDSIPKDLAAAIDSGKIPGSIVLRYFELEKSALFRWLLHFGGFEERLLADDLFLAKVAMECGVGIFTKTAAEYERRRKNFFKELEIVFADVVVAIIADLMLDTSTLS